MRGNPKKILFNELSFLISLVNSSTHIQTHINESIQFCFESCFGDYIFFMWLTAIHRWAQWEYVSTDLLRELS